VYDYVDNDIIFISTNSDEVSKFRQQRIEDLIKVMKQHRKEDELHLRDISEKRFIATDLYHAIEMIKSNIHDEYASQDESY
jgi:hypothetical protein